METRTAVPTLGLIHNQTQQEEENEETFHFIKLNISCPRHSSQGEVSELFRLSNYQLCWSLCEKQVFIKSVRAPGEGR